MAKKRTAAKGGRRRAAKRELINTGTDKRFVRRGPAGRFKESDDVGKSLAADRRRKAKTRAKRGRATKAIGERTSARVSDVPAVRPSRGSDKAATLERIARACQAERCCRAEESREPR